MKLTFLYAFAIILRSWHNLDAKLNLLRAPKLEGQLNTSSSSWEKTLRVALNRHTHRLVEVTMNNRVPSFAAGLLALVALAGCGSPDPVVDSGGLTPDAATADRNPSDDQGNPIIAPDGGNDSDVVDAAVTPDSGTRYCEYRARGTQAQTCRPRLPPEMPIPLMRFACRRWLCDSGNVNIITPNGMGWVQTFPCLFDTVVRVEYVEIGFTHDHNGAYACSDHTCVMYHSPEQPALGFRCDELCQECLLVRWPAGASTNTEPEVIPGEARVITPRRPE